MKKLRIGIIGTGNISRFHAHGYLRLVQSGQAELVACCDLVESKAKAFAEEFGFASVYTDFHEMLSSESLDCVSVCTWNAAHKAATVAALEAGANVLCEKPMALNALEAQEMLEAANRTGRLLQIGFVRRFGKDADTVMQFKESGALGDIYFAKATYLRRDGCPGGWFGDKKFSGGGPLIDLGVHMIDLSIWLMGNPKPVSVSGCTFNKFAENTAESDSEHSSFGEAQENGTFDVEDLAMGFIRFDNGACLQIEFSWASNIRHETRFVELRGTKAGVYWNDDGSCEIYGESADGRLTDDKHFSDMGNDAALRHFTSIILRDAEKDFVPEQGLNMIKILSAIYESAKTGKEVIL